MIKQTYSLEILLSICILLGSSHMIAQYDDLYFDEAKALTEAAQAENESNELVISVDELEVYSEDDNDDSDEYEEYFEYQGQQFEIDAFGFTNRFSSLRLSGFCLPRRYNYFDILREATLNPRSRFNAPFLYAGSFAFLSPYAPYRPFSLTAGEWVLGCTPRSSYYVQRENRSYNNANFRNYNAQPRSSQTRRTDLQPTVSNRTRLVNGDAPQTRRSSLARTTSYRDRSSSRTSTAASSYTNTSSNNNTTNTTSSTTSSSNRATRRP